MSFVVGIRADEQRLLGPGGGPPPFTPAALTPLVWLDAGDAATLFADTGGTVQAAVNDPVARWNDKSGNGNDLSQATLSSRPTRSASGLTLDGGDRINRTALVGPGTSGGAEPQPMTIAVVGTLGASTNATIASNLSGSACTLQRTAASTTLAGSAGALLQATGAPDMAVRRHVALEANGATSRLYSGGTQVGATGNVGTSAWTGLNIGSNSSGGNFVTGDVCELVLVGRVLTAPEWASLHAYFAAKWAL